MIVLNIMDLDVEDSLTKLNTQLNKSMVLMDTGESEISQRKSKKSIKINTKIQPASPPITSPISRKSILKKTEKRIIVKNELEQNIDNNNSSNETNHSGSSINVTPTIRPHNINDLIQGENLIVETTDSTFNLDDLSDNEDIWIMDIPTTIDPKELKGQTLIFGEKSKFKVNDEKYCAVNQEVKCNVTCVLHTGKVKSQYKTVNLKPTGTITVRRKLSSIPKTKPIQIENCSVPFPKNLKIRHPLFGVSYEGNVKNVQ
ncbi:uncharacterized protein LOC122713883 isoform X1 [Apis laboriosa]|uniref:uncharacterized protein LOC122713883 isoform X1 n=2 Tax=Apis laboriosa TaxID=183418 RepID=UPI001CC3F04D|nr:uncharacterized protein LOC122713883 isoform X1 [Apis laboriosa]